MQNLTNLGTIRTIMDRFGFTFSKSLGQNFIVNPSVCPKIAELGGAESEVGVLEIGAGFGVLTNELAARAEKVVVVELDSRLLPVLSYTLSDHKNVKVINQDILKTDLPALLAEEFGEMEVVVCANLPYYITSPILMMLLESRLPVKSITVMVQKEAGERICAVMPSRACGAVTAAVRYYSKPQILFPVSRGSFYPSPNVDSMVVRLNVKKELPLEGEAEKRLFRVVKAAFGQRRKTLVNTLSSGLKIEKARAAEAIAEAGLKPTVRAEELSMDEFIRLSQILTEC